MKARPQPSLHHPTAQQDVEATWPHVQVEDGAGGLSLDVARQLQLSEGLGFRSFAGA